MEQLAFFDIPSPCINVCQNDSRGYCLGCFRSRDERFYWNSYSDAQKHEVMRLCRDRKRRKLLALYKARQEALAAERANANGSLNLEENEPLLDLGDFNLD
ncbi:DUF1289 domain-containing protein [Shewanella cyperi]|uniref:DUF1289 domain-containing protein n=1 Tax=Shewanella cyperi TaxID=2814292 RepID=A0A974XP76_9GAMM|nr:DUF1289 domain-containing protein [Shewanella cyperi]QSX30701.1 DUF1289 domain-containing protein [Shewanella cyperi]